MRAEPAPEDDSRRFDWVREQDIARVLDDLPGTGDLPAPLADAAATPFGLRSWLDHFGDSQMVLFRLRRTDRTEAVLPLVRRQMGRLGTALRHWSSPGNYYWRFGYPLAPGDSTGRIESLLEGLARSRSWDVLELGPLLTSSEHFAALLAAGQQLGLRPESRGRKPDPVVLLKGSWSQYYGSLAGDLRTSIERGERRLANQGTLSFQCCRGGTNLERHLREFYELEASGWKGREGTAIACDVAVEGFYTSLAHEAATRGCLRLYELRHNEALIAGDFAVACGDDVIHMLKIAYDERQRRCSPGQIIRKCVLQQLFDEGGASIYDLMPGGGDHADYKFRWANAVREYATVRLSNPATLGGRIARGALASHRLWKRWRSAKVPA